MFQEAKTLTKDYFRQIQHKTSVNLLKAETQKLQELAKDVKIQISIAKNVQGDHDDGTHFHQYKSKFEEKVVEWYKNELRKLDYSYQRRAYKAIS